MKINMKDWVKDIIDRPVKSSIPVLSFPCVTLMGITVNQLIASSDLQAEGMYRVAQRIPSHASVSMMDLSVEAEAFGAPVRFSDMEVPTVMGAVVKSMADAEALQIPQVGAGRTGIYVEAIGKACSRITDRPVLAGVIGPFSLAGRLQDVVEIMVNCMIAPDMVHKTMEKATEFLISYIEAYKAVGANGIVMAEPLTGLLPPDMAETFSEPYVKRIIDTVQSDDFLVVYHNCGNNTILMIDSILRVGAGAYHFGNAISMKEMMQHIPHDILAMGNVDPAGQFANGTVESIKAATKKVMSECCGYPNFMVSSGCDIPPHSPWANIDAFFEAIKEFYAERA